MIPTYLYENLSDFQFEGLIILICQELFGYGVQGFAPGCDGGRDAKFHGKAQYYPSSSEPWEGLVIIQAKHTKGHNKSFSDLDVYSKKNGDSIIAKEMPRVRKLRETDHLDYYMLFSNRRLTANKEAELVRYIADETGLPACSIRILGIEEIERYMKRFPDISRIAEIDPIDSPLIVSPSDLAEIIEALQKHRDEIVKKVSDVPPSPRTSYSDKNILNNMTEEYARHLREKNLKDTPEIQKFLSNPENKKYLKMYISMVDEFQSKIIAHRKDYQSFDKIMEHLLELLFSRDETLNRHKALTRLMLFYMYWNCDIGINKNVETN